MLRPSLSPNRVSGLTGYDGAAEIAVMRRKQPGTIHIDRRPIPPIAICSSQVCEFKVRLHNPQKGTAIPIPPACEKCCAEMISLCPNCGWLLTSLDNTTDDRGQLCRQDIRDPFGRKMLRRAKSSDKARTMRMEYSSGTEGTSSDG